MTAARARRRSERGRWPALLVCGAAILAGSAPSRASLDDASPGAPLAAPAEPSAGDDASWAAAVQGFKVRLHALAGEALILQLKTSGPQSSVPSFRSRKLRWEAQNRLSDALRSVNALLSMVEIAEHSDRSDRVRQVLLLWLDSSRKNLSEHLAALDVPSGGQTSPDAATAAFIEELKILLAELGGAYRHLEEALGGS